MLIKNPTRISPGLNFRDDICVKIHGGLFLRGLIFEGVYYRDFTVYV